MKKVTNLNNQYNIWNKWDPLKTVMLGDTYSAEFYRDIKNNKTRSALSQIADETQEDLEGFSNILKDFGCEVLRPELDPSDSIMNYTNSKGQLHQVPRSPLQPRDTQVVLGNKIFYIGYDHQSVTTTLDKYNNTDILELGIPLAINESFYNNIRCQCTDDWPLYHDYFNNFTKEDYFKPHVWEELLGVTDKGAKGLVTLFPGYTAPQLTTCGQDLYMDKALEKIGHHNDAELVKRHVRAFRDNRYIKDTFTVNTLNIGGHNDSQFALLKPGALLTLDNIQKYEKTFPGWDVCYLEHEGWDKVKPFINLKQKTAGGWWVPGQEDNDEFTHFVQTWLSNWVGYVEETVFDVNVLVLDEHHVCVSQMDNPIVNAFLKKHNMEPVYVPWRHRYFWDGGLHCLTLDLYREGAQVDYFPDRTECVVCDGYKD